MVHSDQKRLRFRADQRIMGEQKHKWVSKLLGFDFEIKKNTIREMKIGQIMLSLGS